MELLGSYDGNITALLSAHQSIGVPQPLKLFGTEEQKRSYLPRCAARRDLGLRAHRGRRRLRSGAPRHHRRARAGRRRTTSSNGEKLWCTNGTIAELLVVMAARSAARGAISAFVVETGVAGREGRAPLPLHGLQGARQRA